jgi:hypothetical protein
MAKRIPLTVLMLTVLTLTLLVCTALAAAPAAAQARQQRRTPATIAPIAPNAPWPAKTSAKTFLIIAPERFHDALRPFVLHKQRQLTTRLVSLEEVLSTARGEDDPEKLKRYLYRAWRERGAGYVLLVGDGDVMPVRYMVLDRKTPAAFNYAFYPSDLYYSDLVRSDGTYDNWNARRDGFHAGYYGEVRGEHYKEDGINFDRVDYRPDIAVGRWPASTEAQVRTVAAKTVRYEQDLLGGTKPGARRAALLAVGGWVDSRPAMDTAAGAVGAAGWTVEKRYFADARRNDRTPAPDKAQLSRLLREGAGLICHAGHGSESTWDGCLDPSVVDGLQNADRLPVMFSVGCSTGRFAPCPPYEAYTDVAGKQHRGTNVGEVFTEPPPPPAPYQVRNNPSGLGERLLCEGTGGAVAYIGCNTGGQPCGLTLFGGLHGRSALPFRPALPGVWATAGRAPSPTITSRSVSTG